MTYHERHAHRCYRCGYQWEHDEPQKPYKQGGVLADWYKEMHTCPSCEQDECYLIVQPTEYGIAFSVWRKLDLFWRSLYKRGQGEPNSTEIRKMVTKQEISPPLRRIRVNPMNDQLKKLIDQVEACVIAVEQFKFTDETEMSFQDKSAFTAKLTSAHQRLNDAKRHLQANLESITPKPLSAITEDK